MNGINDRIKQVFAVKNLNMSEVERECGFKPQTFSTSLRRGSVLGTDKVMAILSAYPDISSEWLFRGTGDMLLTSNEKDLINDNAQAFKSNDYEMSNSDVDISNRIKDIMHEKSLGQKELSSITGVVQSSISAILNGKRSPSPLVKAMCENMGISRDWLVNGVGTKQGNSKNIASDIDEISTLCNLTISDQVSLMKEMNALYDKHQYLLGEAQNIMKTIIEINKRILINNC